MEMFSEDPRCRILIKIVRAQRIDDDPQSVLKVPQVQAGQHEAVTADDLRGGIPHDLIIDLSVAFGLRHVEFAGSDVGYGDPALSLLAVEDTEDEIVLSLLDGIHIQVRAGSDNADHFPLYHALYRAHLHQHHPAGLHRGLRHFDDHPV